MTLLLVMSTLQPFLLPTVQASMLSGIKRQMWQPSKLKIKLASKLSITKNRSTLTTGRLGQSDYVYSPDAELCIDSLNKKDSDAFTGWEMCIVTQANWLVPIENLKGNDSLEYQCMELYCHNYCLNLVGHSFCNADQSAALLKNLQADFDRNVEVCKPWASWIPPMESLPKITPESVNCVQTIAEKKDVVKCGNVVEITDPNQLAKQLCKPIIEVNKCEIDAACKYCKSANKALMIEGQIWSPGKVECSKWSSDEPKFECPSNTLLIVSIIIGVIAILVMIGVVVYCMCLSSSDGGGGSRSGNSKPSSAANSHKPGSSMGGA